MRHGVRRDAPVVIWSVVLAVVVLGPGLAPGYLLVRDMVWVPDLALRPDFLGLGSGLPRAVPSDAVVAVLDQVVPGMLLQKLVLLGVLGVLILLALRYRDLSRTLAAFLPSVLAALVTVSVLGLLGHALDLVAMSALLMVISMGVDYGVFLVDASESTEERTVALLSVFLAATTTVLGFGLLAISRHPLLSAIGITATVGMTACLILAPTTLILLTSTSRRSPLSPHDHGGAR
jgi:hypothetical protein